MKLKWTKHSDLAIRKRGFIHRDEYLDHMTFQTNRRPLYTEIFGPLLGMKERWEAQGATPEELDFSAFQYRCERRHYLPASPGLFGTKPPVVIEETEAHRITLDGLGRRMMLPKTTATLSLPLNYPVETMDDWLKVKPYYEYCPGRIAPSQLEASRKAQAEGDVIIFWIPGGFDEPRELMGEENLCMAYYDEPEMIVDMVETIGNTASRVLQEVPRDLQLNALFIHEDMAGKNGPLVGPSQVREFIAPYYKKLWTIAQERGARIFDQDSDGDMRVVIPEFLNAGVNVMHPMEPAAGMDIVEIRETYGKRLAFYGGINKFALTTDKAAIDRELEHKIPPMLATGGCVFGLDHRIPAEVTLENYRYYQKRMWEYLNDLKE